MHKSARGGRAGYPPKMLTLDSWTHFFPFLLIISPSAGFFGWLNHRATPENPSLPPTPVPDLERLPQVPFEVTSADERFLAEARQLDLSPLDSCHYKVVAELQSSCTDLTEEELAKLAVSLFNCQASSEGRRTYLCTADLTLAECTAEMDPDTWNAYHIMSNRARAVCYATRQTQFKRQAEHTVNALVATAVSQLETMKMLQSSQEELKDLTSESLQKVASSQEKLLVQQEKLQGSQEQMEESMHSNLDQLAQEKALIASGQQQVARLIEGITRRMENISSHLNNQDLDLQEGHKAILQDLTQVQQRAQEVYSKIDTNLDLFLAYRDQTALYYEEVMRKLQKMNESLGLVLYAMDRMQSNVEGRLQHLQRFISWAGFNLSAVNTCVLHGSYFLLAALIMTFLQIPGLPRATLLVLVVANAVSELNHVASLGFQSLTILLVSAVIGNWLLGSICRSVLRGILAFSPLPKKTSSSGAPAVGLKGATGCCITSTPDREDDVGLWTEELEKLPEMSCVSDESHLGQESPEKSGHFFLGEGAVQEASRGSVFPKHQLVHSVQSSRLHHISLTHPTRHEFTLERRSRCQLRPASHLFPSSRDCSPNVSISDVSNSSTSPRLFCQGVTRTGQQCRKKALSGHMLCHVHASGQTSYTT